MSDKTYTVEEANALLPFLAPTLVELRDTFDDAVRIRADIRRAAVTNGWSEKREEWANALARVGELLDRIHNEWHVELKDVAEGLVDFPTVMEGRDAYLCWKLGEPQVAFWHSPEDGFAGRRPL